MARAHLYRPITDSEGNIVPNTRVTIYEAGTSTPLAQSLFTQPAGSPVLNNPFTTSDGYVQFYLDRPQSVRIGLAVQGATETYVDDLPVLPAPEHLVQADQAFQVVNDSTDGYYLQAGQVGQAGWVDAGDLVNSKPSPLNQIYHYDFAGETTEDLTVVNAAGEPVAPQFVDVEADSKPLGWSFPRALRMPVSSRTSIITPPLLWSETGAVIFLYKVLSTKQGQGAAMLRVSVDNDLIYVETPVTPSLTNIWMVGYLDEIPSGTHRITVSHRPGTDLDSQVLIGPIWLQYGNNIPAHDHPGTAELTTRLGPGSEAAFVGATAVGATAKVTGAYGSAFGSLALSAAGAFAAGANASAGPDSVALGYRASALNRTGAVAIGKDSLAQADQAVAIGLTALAQGAGSIAVGPGARTGSGGDSVALGASAQALGYRSVALGRGALVAANHDYSIAVGDGVATTAARQARIGDAQTTVVVPGSFRQTAGDGVYGSTTGKLGFFGAPGIVRPTVVGSRGGNATLASLLTLLASMGLVNDGSTA